MLVKLTPGLSHFGEDDLFGADGTFPGDDLLSISTKILVPSASAEQISGVANPFSGLGNRLFDTNILKCIDSSNLTQRQLLSPIGADAHN